jgi:hypothetical protein
LWLVLIITAWNIIRLITSITWHGILETYAPRPGPVYIGVTGALWTLAGLCILWGFVRGAKWTRMVLILASLGYAIWDWADKLFIQAQLRANWPFDLLTTIILLGFISAIILDPHNRIYFEKETYE